tara:strand:+ start:1277 stop:1936 length:660 start_codon:yes stop_codon:yes gene_type:complete
MALNKLKFNSLNVTPSANEAIKFNSSANGFETGSAGGSMKFIKKLTASSSSTLSFVDGSSDVVLDNTYKEYLFIFKNIHPSGDSATFSFNFSVDTGSNYNVTKTSNFYEAFHSENDAITAVQYAGSHDLVQSTDFQKITSGLGSDNDQCCDGFLRFFDPSSTTFVKHFIGATTSYYAGDYVQRDFFAGYANTTSAVDAVQFKMASGNIDAGTITLYGIN